MRSFVLISFVAFQLNLQTKQTKTLQRCSIQKTVSSTQRRPVLNNEKYYYPNQRKDIHLFYDLFSDCHYAVIPAIMFQWECCFYTPVLTLAALLL